jgi:predicted HTH domain antitoxin
LKTIEIRVPESITERDVKIATAAEAFKKNIISLNRAAEIADIPLQEFLIELKNRNIPAYTYTDEEALQELEL